MLLLLLSPLFLNQLCYLQPSCTLACLLCTMSIPIARRIILNVAALLALSVMSHYSPTASSMNVLAS
jgi:hypothetical protein